MIKITKEIESEHREGIFSSLRVGGTGREGKRSWKHLIWATIHLSYRYSCWKSHIRIVYFSLFYKNLEPFKILSILWCINRHCFLFLLSEHLACKKSIVIMEKIQQWEFGTFTRFKVYWIPMENYKINANFV